MKRTSERERGRGGIGGVTGGEEKNRSDREDSRITVLTCASIEARAARADFSPFSVDDRSGSFPPFGQFRCDSSRSARLRPPSAVVGSFRSPSPMHRRERSKTICRSLRPRHTSFQSTYLFELQHDTGIDSRVLREISSHSKLFSSLATSVGRTSNQYIYI